MGDAEEKKIELALSAHEEELPRFLHDVSPKVVRAVLQNSHLTEDHVLVIATRKNLPTDIFEQIAKDKRWRDSYPIRLALAKNPKTPISVSLSIVRYLRFFDVEELTRCRFLPLAFRHKVEMIVMERIPSMPLGNKKTLAKRAAGNVLFKLLQDRDPELVQLGLSNPHMTEGILYKVISRRNTSPETIRIIAEHPNWSRRSAIRLSLARNTHTPLPLVARFIESMNIMDLRELFTDPSMPIAVRPLLHRELLARGEEPGMAPEEQLYEVEEEDEDMIEQFNDTSELLEKKPRSE